MVYTLHGTVVMLDAQRKLSLCQGIDDAVDCDMSSMVMRLDSV